jgi:hypothetical protein
MPPFLNASDTLLDKTSRTDLDDSTCADSIMVHTMPAKKILPSFCHFKKNETHTYIPYCHYDYRLDYGWYFLGGKFQNSKLF